MSSGSRLTPVGLAAAGLLMVLSPGLAEEAKPTEKIEKRIVMEHPPGKFDRRVIVQHGEGEPEVVFWKGADGEAVYIGGRGFLGVQLIEITPELRRHFGADEQAGVLVGQVEKDSPAAKAGVEVGDLITSVDGEPVSWSGEVGRHVRQKKQGETARLEILRDGRASTLEVEVAERDREPMMLRKFELGGIEGMEIAPLDSAMERALEASRDPALPDRVRQRIELRDAHTHELENRLQELEERMKEMEAQLKKSGGR